MARPILFLTLLGLLSACAEVMPLTGGASDVYAPTVVPGSQSPEQEALHVTQNELKVKFNEYFTLNDPTSTVLMNPKAGKITTTANKKELNIKWEGPLEPNTTYIIQLNGTIRDLNEKNDTVHQFVFSTGSMIDSLKLSGIITDAQSNGAVNGAVIGLYGSEQNPFVDAPLYVAQSDVKGGYQFSYLKPANYQLFAYLDKNKDRMPSIGEKIAFYNESVQSGDTNLIFLRTFLPKDTTQKLQLKLINPGLATLFGRLNLANELSINGNKPTIVKQFESDSILIALPLPIDDYYTIIAAGSDTIQKQFSIKERQKKFSLINKTYKNAWRYSDSLQFECNEQIISIDTSHIQLLDDKKNTIAYQWHVQGNRLAIVPATKTNYGLDLKLKLAAIKGAFNSSDSLNVHFDTKVDTDLSNLTLDLSDLKGNWIIQLMDGSQVIRQFFKQTSDTIVTWNHLLPNTYSVTCIEDLDGNSKWSSGDFGNKIQPERIVRFQLKSKLRPNWDIEEKLVFDE